MTMILTIYVAISVIFSLVFIAGAWWASRARLNEVPSLEVEPLDRNHDQAAVLSLGRPSIAFGESDYR